MSTNSEASSCASSDGLSSFDEGRLYDWEEVIDTRTRQGPASNRSEAIARRIDRLPASASSFYGPTNAHGWEPSLRELLQGTRDSRSPLRCLRGMEDTLVAHVYGFVASQWSDHVTLTVPASCIGHLGNGSIYRFPLGRENQNSWAGMMEADDLPHKSRMALGSNQTEPSGGAGEKGEAAKGGYVSFAACGHIDFPEPADRNVNMMPFVFGEKSSLPPDLQCYYDSAVERCPYSKDELGRVGYLTVHESFVEAGSEQRRGGLHIESPGFFSDGVCPAFSPGTEHHWGIGMFFDADKYEGGIYMASSVENTSEVWDALVDKNVKGIVDRHGGCEHLRKLIGTGTKLGANELIWMTDCTPHEAIAQESSGYRQFFRVVTSCVSHWYADHSTPNPLVDLPDDVVIVHGSKFDAPPERGAEGNGQKKCFTERDTNTKETKSN